jgi:hypothetical protein
VNQLTHTHTYRSTRYTLTPQSHCCLFQWKSRHTLVVLVFINPPHPRNRVPLLVYYIATHSEAHSNSSTGWMDRLALNTVQMWGPASPLIPYSLLHSKWSISVISYICACGFHTMCLVTRDNMHSIEYTCTQAITSLCSIPPLPSLQVRGRE